MPKLIIAILAVSSLLFGLAGVSVAAGSVVYITPASGSYTTGQTLTINVRVNAQAPINGIQANLTYPTDKFTVGSVSYGGSAFGMEGESVASGGVIRMGRASSGDVTGDNLVGTVSLVAKVSSGSASIGFAGGTSLANNGSFVASTTSGGNYSFYAPATPVPTAVPAAKTTAPKPGTTPTPTPAAKTPTPKPGASPAATPAILKPEITSAKLQGNSSSTAALVIVTNEETKVILTYGLTSVYGLTVASTTATKEHNLALDGKYLLPKTTYHYQVSMTDAAGNTASSGDKTFTTVGLPAQITVLGSDNKPLSGAKVTVDGETKTADSKGVVVFDLSLGQKTATLQYAGSTAMKNFIVDASVTSPAPLTVVAGMQVKKTPAYGLIALVLLLIFGLISLAFYAMRHWHFGSVKKPAKTGTVITGKVAETDTVVVDQAQLSIEKASSESSGEAASVVVSAEKASDEPRPAPAVVTHETPGIPIHPDNANVAVVNEINADTKPEINGDKVSIDTKNIPSSGPDNRPGDHII